MTSLLGSTAGLYWAERAVVTFHIEDPASPWKGLGPMLLGLAGPLSYGFAAGLVLVLIGELFFAASPGKLVTRTVIRAEDGSQAAPGTLVKRFLIKTSGALLFCVALVTGRWELLPLAVVAALTVVVGGWGLWLPRGSSLHDRAAGTTVRRV